MALAEKGSSGDAPLRVVASRQARPDLDLVSAAGLTCEEALAGLGSGFAGLSCDDAADRLREFGPNALGTHRVRASAVLLRQIRNPTLVMLLAGALVRPISAC